MIVSARVIVMPKQSPLTMPKSEHFFDLLLRGTALASKLLEQSSRPPLSCACILYGVSVGVRESSIVILA